MNHTKGFLRTVSHSNPARAAAEREGIPWKAYRAYCAQERAAKARGIAFRFTIEEWWSWWQEDGRWARRGKRKGQLGMARHGDKGAYEPGNVFPATAKQNQADMPDRDPDIWGDPDTLRTIRYPWAT